MSGMILWHSESTNQKRLAGGRWDKILPGTTLVPTLPLPARVDVRLRYWTR
jgi:hypothetical protein